MWWPLYVFNLLCFPSCVACLSVSPPYLCHLCRLPMCHIMCVTLYQSVHLCICVILCFFNLGKGWRSDGSTLTSTVWLMAVPLAKISDFAKIGIWLRNDFSSLSVIKIRIFSGFFGFYTDFNFHFANVDEKTQNIRFQVLRLYDKKVMGIWILFRTFFQMATDSVGGRWGINIQWIESTNLIYFPNKYVTIAGNCWKW